MADCGFYANISNELLAIVFSYGVHNKEITKKLLREKDIKLDTFLEHARAITRAEAYTYDVKGEKTAVNVVHNNNNPSTSHKAKKKKKKQASHNTRRIQEHLL